MEITVSRAKDDGTIKTMWEEAQAKGYADAKSLYRSKEAELLLRLAKKAAQELTLDVMQYGFDGLAVPADNPYLIALKTLDEVWSGLGIYDDEGCSLYRYAIQHLYENEKSVTHE